METERDLLSNPLILVALEVELPINKFSEFNLKYTGVGKINAAMSTCINIQKYQPSCIINFGSAGSLDNTISGLVAVDKVYQRDMDVRGLGFELGLGFGLGIGLGLGLGVGLELGLELGLGPG